MQKTTIENLEMFSSKSYFAYASVVNTKSAHTLSNQKKKVTCTVIGTVTVYFSCCFYPLVKYTVILVFLM